jgi:hypothetical protein
MEAAVARHCGKLVQQAVPPKIQLGPPPTTCDLPTSAQLAA